MDAYTETVDSDRTTGTLSAFVCGAALGAAVGAAMALVFAPANGQDTRAYLKRRGNELGRDAMERGRETLRSQSERVKSALATGWDRAESAMSHARERGEAAYREARGSNNADDPSLVHTSYQSRGQRSPE
jgi:gas vesicle protein